MDSRATLILTIKFDLAVIMPRLDWLAMLSPEFDGDFTDNFNNNSELCRQQKKQP
ncbi:MAG: hypothetical protein LRY40_04515 [Shewanella fodinae]|nr:hypothetical protein [Shewanella fodinae]